MAEQRKHGTVPDKVVLLDPDELTLGEIEEIQDYAGDAGFQAWLKGNFEPKAMTIMTLITLRRSDPEFTLDEVRGLKFARVDPFEKKKGPKRPNPHGSAGSGS